MLFWQNLKFCEISSFPLLFFSVVINNISFSMDVAQLQHGQLEHADGNGDWVLTIFKALSLVSRTCL